MDGHRRGIAAGLIIAVLVAVGCGPKARDPQIEAEKKAEADAMMQQYRTPAPPSQP